MTKIKLELTAVAATKPIGISALVLMIFSVMPTGLVQVDIGQIQIVLIRVNVMDVVLPMTAVLIRVVLQGVNAGVEAYWGKIVNIGATAVNAVNRLCGSRLIGEQINGK